MTPSAPPPSPGREPEPEPDHPSGPGDSDATGRPGGAPAALGPLLVALRTARGWSQLGVAERLCAAAGVPTITRHEVSRWERGRRVPGEFWLGWLAAVLDAPPDELTAAAGVGTHAGTRPTATAGRRRTRRAAGRPSGAAPAVARAPTGTAASAGARRALIALAYRWLADPAGRLGPVALHAGGGDPAVAADLAALRRLDDLVGGADLAALGRRRLGAPAGPAPAGPAAGPVEVRIAAEAAQLAGWLAADAGDAPAALRAYRRALVRAAAAGDRLLGGYVLGCASHLLADRGDPAGAVLLARIGHAGLPPDAPVGLRAVLLHRLAFAAAVDGRHRLARSALATAERAGAARDAAGRADPARADPGHTAADLAPGREPSWLYWLDDAELAAMTGRCLAALGRPLLAEPLLAAATRRPASPRGRALYGGWWARVLLDLGEVEQACAVADGALLDAVRAGSARAATGLAAVRARLSAYQDEACVRRHLDTAAAVTRYLPTVAPGR